MSFLGGIGQFAANAVAPTLNVMAANAQGQREAQQMQQQRMIEQLALQRQQQQLEMQRTLQQSEIPKNAAAADESSALASLHRFQRDNPTLVYGGQGLDENGNVVRSLTRGPSSAFQGSGPPQGAPAKSFDPSLPTSLQGGPNQPPQGGPTPAPTRAGSPMTIPTGLKPLKTAASAALQQANGTLNGRDWKGSYNKQTGQYLNLDGTPIPSGSRFTPFAQQTFTPVITTGPNGAQDVSAFGTKSGTVKETGAQAKAAGTAGTPQSHASLVAGLNTLTTADKDATAYEDDVLAQLHGHGKATPGWLGGTLGAFADPTKHPDLAPLAGGTLNYVNPGYAKYNKSITAAANAGMLIAQRPSDVRLKKEQYLAGISTNPTEDLIQQSRQWRADMKAAFQDALAKTPAQGGGAPTSVDPLLKKYNLTPPSDD